MPAGKICDEAPIDWLHPYRRVEHAYANRFVVSQHRSNMRLYAYYLCRFVLNLISRRDLAIDRLVVRMVVFYFSHESEYFLTAVFGYYSARHISKYRVRIARPVLIEGVIVVVVQHPLKTMDLKR